VAVATFHPSAKGVCLCAGHQIRANRHHQPADLVRVNLRGTHSTPLVVAIELIQLITLIVCGAALQGIAGHLPRFKGLLLGITVEMLVRAIWVEAQYWNAMPIWHHFVFFALIILGLAIGSALADRWRAVRT
jgi:hypothetical protein